MTRKAQLEGATKPAPKAESPDIADAIAAFIDNNPEKWEEMRLWPAQSVFAEIVKLSK